MAQVSMKRAGRLEIVSCTMVFGSCCLDIVVCVTSKRLGIVCGKRVFLRFQRDTTCHVAQI